MSELSRPVGRIRGLYLLIGLVLFAAALPAAAQVADGGTEPAAEREAPPVHPLDSLPRVELDSPRAAMFTFLRGMVEVQQGRFGDHAWLVVYPALDVPVDPEVPEDRAAVHEAAEALLTVLDKLGTIEEASLPDAEDVQREGVTRYVFFPGSDEQQWVWEELKAFGLWPQGRIVLAEVEPGVWRFTAETVRNATTLAESLAPLPPRHIQPVTETEPEFLTVFGPTFARTATWGWLSLLGAIFIGLVAGKLASTLLRAVGTRLSKRGWRARGLAFDSAAAPASLALLTLGLAIGLHTFIYLDEDLILFVNAIISFLYLVALGWLLYNLVDVVEMALRRITSRTSSKLDDMVLPLVRKSLRIFIIVVFSLMVAQNVFGLNITGWLAGLGIAGLAVSLAAQDSVKNLFGSLTVFFDKPFVVGDFIDYAGVTGTVEEIGFRSTRIRTVPGHVVTVPNMKWIDNQVENISRRPSIRREMNIAIRYDTEPDRVEEAIRIVREVLVDPEVVESGAFDMQTTSPKVALDTLNASSMNIKAYYWYQLGSDPSRGFFSWMAHCEVVNLKLFRRFSEAGIPFALPAQTTYLAGDTMRQLDVHVAPQS